MSIAEGPEPAPPEHVQGGASLPGNGANGPDHDMGLRAHRVIASLNRDQVDFLDKLGKDALFSCGSKLSRTEILSAMVNVLRRLNVNAEGVATGDELEERMVDAMRRVRGDEGGQRRHG